LTAAVQLKFIGPLLLGQFILNLLFQADLQLLGAFARDAAAVAGKTAEDADHYVGAYRASQLFGFLPYQLLIAVSFVLFPLLARAHKDGDRVAVAEYVRTGVRIALILAGLAVSISSGLSEGLLRLVFPSQPFDRIGGESMEVLSIGLGAFAIFGILVTVLNSLGRERTATGLTAVAFALIASTCFGFVRGEPFGENLLLRTAFATTTAHLLATGAAAFLVKRAAGGVVSLPSLLRVLGCVAISVFVARHLPAGGKLLTIGYSALIAVMYLGLLTLSKELGRGDFETVASIVSGRRAR
jgi:stage V sporulation protein B